MRGETQTVLKKLFVFFTPFVSTPVPELQKAGSLGSAEPNFFQILCQICPVFRQNLTKFYQTLQKLTKVYQSLPTLPNLTNILPNFT